MFVWDMGKYDPLGYYLKRQAGDEFELTFTEIERVLLSFLPHRAKQSEWWSLEQAAGRSSVQRDAWGVAGFRASLIAGKERVRFQRIAPRSRLH